MNDVSFHVPYIFGNQQNSKKQRIRGRTEGTTKDREVWYQERPTVGQDQREAKLTNGNLQISKCLCIYYKVLLNINVR